MSEPASPPPSPPRPPPSTGLWRWTVAQFAAAATGLVAVAGGGIVRAVWRRQFSFRASCSAVLVLVLGFAATAAHVGQSMATGEPPDGLWVAGLSLGAATLGGALAACLTGRLAGWELQAAMAVATAGAFGLLQRPTALAEPWQLTVGHQAFGPLWDRTLGLWAAGAMTQALLGASLVLFVRGLGSSAGKSRPSLRLSWRLARRHLAGQGRFGVSGPAAVAVLGIALGVAALVTTNGIMSGYQDDIRSRILGTNAHLVVQKYGLDFTAHAEVRRQLETVADVAASAPFVFTEAMLAGGAHGTGVLLKGIDVDSAVAVTDVGRNVCAAVEGIGSAARCVRQKAPSDAGAAALAACLGPAAAAPMPLSRAFASEAATATASAPAAGSVAAPPLLVGLSLFQRLGLPLGSQVRLLTPVGTGASRGNAPRRQTFTLAGVFSSGMHEFDSRLVYVALRDSQQLLAMGDAVSGVELRLHAPERVERTSRQVLAAIGRYPYRTLDWRQLNAGIFTALVLQKVVMFLVLIFIVVVASFNVASTLFLAVAQKAPQVAVLKAMGAQDGTVVQMFLLEGLCTGVCGCAAGLLLGILSSAVLARLHIALAADVYMVGAVRVRLAAGELAAVAYSTLVICHFAALVPALAAASRRRAIEAP